MVPPLALEMLQGLTEVLTAEMATVPAEAIKGTEKVIWVSVSSVPHGLKNISTLVVGC